jgi:hypothetical protein
MGAALTYARRYALFALVGIAGEDDLDAPELNPAEPVEPTVEKPPLNRRSRSNGGRNHLARKISADRVTNEQVSYDNPRLKSQLSAVLRDQLVSELKGVNSTEDAAIWARRSLPAKSSLSAEDARQLENAFESRLTELERGIDDAERRPSSSGFIHNDATSLEQKGLETTRTSTIARIEESTHAHPQPRRIRDREHVKFVAGHPCLICGRSPADPHHLRFAQSRALGSKVSDEFTVPLCRGHHREVHQCGDEVAWWAKTGIDALGVANTLWRETRPLVP